MTAEIAIMNKEAIALAADSAVTLKERDGQKIFTSANKIFALSKYHPVGVMVYGNSKLMEVPWETIIKMYRSRLGKKEFDDLKDYANDFILFLNKKSGLFPEFVQEKYFESHVYGYFYHIRGLIEQKIEEVVNEKEGITEKEIVEIVSEVIKKQYVVWEEADLIPSVSGEDVKTITEKYQVIINEAEKEIFEKLPIDKDLSMKLIEIGANLFVKYPEDIVISDYTGVVIAGFGKKNIFPSLQCFLIDGVVNDILKYKELGYSEITFQNNAQISPFAQREMVHTFMEGVEDRYQQAIEEDLSQLLEKYSDIIVDNIEKLNDSEKVNLREKLRKINNDMLDQYEKRLETYRSINYINPVMKVVAILPKDELAAMAESLVNLTSFKRKVSIEAETVGGPIDVAVISKGDGFIWIKRKHYFKPELNPQFFENYNKEVEHEKGK
jgi:hypothetical protein